MVPLSKYSPALQLVIFLGIYVVCSFIYSIIFLGWILPYGFGITSSDLESGQPAEAIKFIQLLYSVFCFLVPAWVFSYLTFSRPMRETGLRSRFYAGWALFGIVILIASLPAVGVLSDINHRIHFGPMDQAFRAMEQRAREITKTMLVMPNAGSFLFNIFIIAVIPAIAEEFFFRGLLQRLLIRITKRAWLGIGIAAVVFSLLHGEMLGFLPRIALGIVLGAIYYFSKNLWYAIIAHFFNNAFQIVMVYLYQQNMITQDIMQDNPTPFIYGVISVIAVTGLFFIFRRFVFKKNYGERLDQVV